MSTSYVSNIELKSGKTRSADARDNKGSQTMIRKQIIVIGLRMKTSIAILILFFSQFSAHATTIEAAKAAAIEITAAAYWKFKDNPGWQIYTLNIWNRLQQISIVADTAHPEYMAWVQPPNLDTVYVTPSWLEGLQAMQMGQKLIHEAVHTLGDGDECSATRAEETITTFGYGRLAWGLSYQCH